uniref:Uncharacterized protein n=1 Tax=Kalanchoe fedtschenkoi TaxID=63787 RepID=A0A7N0RIY0_KALFE
MQISSANSQSLQRSQSHQEAGGDGSRGSSFRVYYGGSSGSVPFKWESAPGTPIHARSSAHQTSSGIPPLTPPPSYHSADTTRPGPASRSRFNLLVHVLQKLKRSATHVSPRYSSSSSSSSSSYNSLGGFKSGSVRRDYLRIRRLCGSGSYSRPRSPLRCVGDSFDEDYGVMRTASFGVRSSDSTLRFTQKKKGFPGCFGS